MQNNTTGSGNIAPGLAAGLRTRNHVSGYAGWIVIRSPGDKSRSEDLEEATDEILSFWFGHSLDPKIIRSFTGL